MFDGCSYSDEESDSGEEFVCEPETFLMNKMGLAENALFEVINDHQAEVKVGSIIYYFVCVIDRNRVLLNFEWHI